jgi:hypothetical protein
LRYQKQCSDLSLRIRKRAAVFTEKKISLKKVLDMLPNRCFRIAVVLGFYMLSLLLSLPIFPTTLCLTKASSAKGMSSTSFLSQLKMSSIETDDGIDDAIGAAVGPLPTVSSKHNYGDETPQNVIHDIWIVGAGTLGMMAVKEWKTMFPESNIVAETRSDSRHAELISMGVTPRLRSERCEADDMTARYLLISLPPSSNKEDYVGEISNACRLWAGPLGQGHLAFTSSVSVYGESNGNTVDEVFRLDTRSDRSTKMIAAEESVLSRGGSVLRLAGLYTQDRGPHTVWLRNGTVSSNADGLVNLLHYEDAAKGAIAACLTGVAGTAYLACDDEPVSRQEICEAALASGLFPGVAMPTVSHQKPRLRVRDVHLKPLP